MALVLGIDGGGSRTTAAIASGLDVVGIASGGPSNIRTYGPEAAVAVIESVVAESLRKANVENAAIHAIAAGLAGISRRSEREPVEDWLTRSFPGRSSTLVADVELVLAAGSNACEGVAAVSGTGSIVFGRTAAGRTARSGGWGPTVGDPGSGYAIGRAALLATAEALDGIGPRGPLSDLLVARTGVASSDELGFGQEPSAIASLVPAVTEAADAGDPMAIAILHAAGRELARQVASVLRRLQWVGDVPLVLAGGVLVHVDVVRDTLLRELHAAGWNLGTPSVVEEPVLGAVAIAEALLAPVPSAQ